MEAAACCNRLPNGASSRRALQWSLEALIPDPLAGQDDPQLPGIPTQRGKFLFAFRGNVL